jgi:hypothetical protein
VGDGLDPRQAKAAGGALDRVDDPEDDVQGIRARRAGLDGEEFLVVPVEAFKTLHEEVADQLLLEGDVHVRGSFDGSGRQDPRHHGQELVGLERLHDPTGGTRGAAAVNAKDTPLALAAAWEPRLRLGTAIVPAYTRSPACFAQSVASLADAAPGRFAIGIGSSSNVIVERWNGVPFVEPYKKVRDVVRFLRDALSGEKIAKTHMSYGQGASAEMVAMGTIFAADHYGLPVSTTHVLSSGVAGTMAASGSGLQLATIRNLLMAWVLTLPCAIVLSMTLFFVFVHIF